MKFVYFVLESLKFQVSILIFFLFVKKNCFEKAISFEVRKKYICM